MRVVLAYSGGLDTSVIVPWLREHYGAEVVAYVADVGQGEDLEAVRQKALRSGAVECLVDDLRLPFVRDYLFPLVQSGAVYESKYLLGTAIARPIIAWGLARAAERFGADAVAHGSTGRGNDQVRFEVGVLAHRPDLKIIAPWREWDLRSREDEMAYAAEHGIEVDQGPRDPYSRDGNLWHLSHEGGDLEDPGAPPPTDLLRWVTAPEKAPATGEEIEIGFEAGRPVSVDGQALEPVALLELVNQRAAAHGVGIVSMLENRLLGMKSRGVYETPGGTLLTSAHRDLEELCLDRDTLHFKAHVALRYAELVYDGLWFSPLRESLQAFIQETQRYLTGTARLYMRQGAVSSRGARSRFSLYKPSISTFGVGDLDHRAASGFITCYGLPTRVRAMLGRIPR